MNKSGCLLSIAVALLHGGLAFGDVLSTLPPSLKRIAAAQEGEPAFTEAQAKQWIDELRPLVEQATGATFVEVPGVRLCSRKEVGPVFSEEFAAWCYGTDLTADKDDAALSALAPCLSLELYMLGRYSFNARQIVLVPGNFGPLKQAYNADDLGVEMCVKLTLVREMTRALQHQRAAIDQWISDARTIEQLRILLALSTAHANRVMHDVSAKIDTTNRALQFVAQHGADLFMAGTEPRMDSMNPITKKYELEHLLAAESFLESRCGVGELDEAWTLLRYPPLTLQVLKHPDEYVPPSDVHGVLVDALDDLRGRFDPQAWEVVPEWLDQEGVRLMLRANGIGVTTRLQAIFVSGWRAGYRKLDKTESSRLVLAEFSDSHASQAFFEEWCDRFELQYQAAHHILIKFPAIKRESVKVEGCDEARLTTYANPEAPEKAKLGRIESLQVRCGSFIIVATRASKGETSVELESLVRLIASRVKSVEAQP